VHLKFADTGRAPTAREVDRAGRASHDHRAPPRVNRFRVAGSDVSRAELKDGRDRRARHDHAPLQGHHMTAELIALDGSRITVPDEGIVLGREAAFRSWSGAPHRPQGRIAGTLPHPPAGRRLDRRGPRVGERGPTSTTMLWTWARGCYAAETSCASGHGGATALGRVVPYDAGAKNPPQPPMPVSHPARAQPAASWRRHASLPGGSAPGARARMRRVRRSAFEASI